MHGLVNSVASKKEEILGGGDYYGSPETAMLLEGQLSTRDMACEAFSVTDERWLWLCGAGALLEWTVEKV